MGEYVSNFLRHPVEQLTHLAIGGAIAKSAEHNRTIASIGFGFVAVRQGLEFWKKRDSGASRPVPGSS